MMVSAIRDAVTKDTALMQPEGRVPIARVVAGPRVWTKGPVQLTTTAGQVSYQPSGKPRAFAPGKITLLGMVRNVPVFAAPRDAGPLRPEVEALAAEGSDLEKSLQKRLRLRRQMSTVRTLYVPTSLVNCTFQTLTRPAPRRR